MNPDVVKKESVLSQPLVMMGLGHVGLTLALALADVGFSVYGYDVKDSIRKNLRIKQAHFKEKGMVELLDTHIGNNLTIIDDLNSFATPTTYFITVGTPFNLDNTPDYTYIKQVSAMMGKVIKTGDLVILRSTIPMGTTREIAIPIMERESNLKVGVDFDVAFAPERTVEGNAFHELRTLPQIVGGYNEQSKNRTSAIFEKLTDTIISLDTLEEAEIVKLINNTYRETIFSYANQVSLLTRAWGIDTKRVIAAANHGYSRSQVPFPSPGIGGYCLTKDSYLFAASAKKKKVDTRFLAQARETSSIVLDGMVRDIIEFARSHKLNKPYKIGILGFAFKGVPETSDVRGSSTFSLLKRLNHIGGFVIVGYDPVVTADVVTSMGAMPKDSMQEVIENSDIVIIMNNHPLFSTVNPEMFTGLATTKKLLFDTWGLCDKKAFVEKGIEYWAL